MSKLVILTNGDSGKVAIIKKVRGFTDMNFAQISHAIENDLPVAEINLASIEEEDVSNFFTRLRELQIDQEGGFAIYNLLSNEDFAQLSDKDKELRYVNEERLVNIMDSYASLVRDIA